MTEATGAPRLGVPRRSPVLPLARGRAGVGHSSRELSPRRQKFVDILASEVPAGPQALAALDERYGFEMDPTSGAGLLERFGLRLFGEPICGATP